MFALLALVSLALMGASGAQDQDEDAVQRILRQEHERHAAGGLMRSPRLTPQQVEAVLKDSSLTRYETATSAKLPVSWPATAEFSYVYEVDHLIVRGGTQLEVVAPGATPYGYAEEAYVLTKHLLTKQPALPPGLGNSATLYGEYGVPLEKVTFSVAQSQEAHPVYFVTKWKAAKVSARMSWPKPSEVEQLQFQPRRLPGSEVVQVAKGVWSLAPNPAEFLARYPTISRYKAPSEVAFLENGVITGQCGNHAQVILLLARQVGIPAIYVSYTAHWSKLNESHAFTALWDGSAWVNNPFPWERGNHEIGPVLGRSMVGSRPGSPQTTIANKSTIVPVR